MINIPDATYLALIQTKNVHADLKAKDPHSPAMKKKYKLMCRIIDLEPVIKIYPFFILTSQQLACQATLTICVKSHEWENKDARHLNGDSYIDIKKIDHMDKAEVLIKQKDSTNGFHKVATIPEVKFQELQSKLTNIHMAQRISDTDIAIITSALSQADIPQAVLNKLLGP